jgi:hypothetical protein
LGALNEFFIEFQMPAGETPATGPMRVFAPAQQNLLVSDNYHSEANFGAVVHSIVLYINVLKGIVKLVPGDLFQVRPIEPVL